MKKILFLMMIVSLCITSCSKRVYPEMPIEQKPEYVEVSCTAQGITFPTFKGNKIPSITKEELIGSVVSLETGGNPITITPLAQVNSSSKHEEGAIVREFDVNGNNPILIYNQSGWLITDAVYTGEKPFPDYIMAETKTESNRTVCKKFLINSSGRFFDFISFENGKPVQEATGYKFIDQCTQEVAFTSNPRVYLDKIFIRVDGMDNRNLEKTKGYKLPNQPGNNYKLPDRQ
jgi:hypothetical protein